MGLTTGLIRSSSEGFVEIFELGTVAECTGTEELEPLMTVGGGREAAVGGRGVAETVGLGASQEPTGTRAAAAALPKAVFRMVVSEDDEEVGVATERGAEGTADFGGVGAAALRNAAMSTFPTGV